jgi:hypothetical protein
MAAAINTNQLKPGVHSLINNVKGQTGQQNADTMTGFSLSLCLLEFGFATTDGFRLLVSVGVVGFVSVDGF